MNPQDFMNDLPTTAQGWLSWTITVVIVVLGYLAKWLSERRSDNKAIDRLEKALVEERALRRASDAENRLLSDRINDLVQTFSDQNATNARLEEQLKHVVDQNEALRRQIVHLKDIIQGVTPP